MDQAIQQANEKLAFVSQDKEALRMYQMREMALCDITSGINHARREGIAEGIAEGRIEGKIEGLVEGEKMGRIEGEKMGRIAGIAEGEKKGLIEAAKNAMQAGLSMEVIREITGLSYDDLNVLKYND